MIDTIYTSDNGDTQENKSSDNNVLQSIAYGDVSNSTSEYRTRTDYYLGNGTIYERDQVLDDGTSDQTIWDTTGARPWWQEIGNYDTQGRLTKFETDFRDGTKSVDSYNYDPNVSWKKDTQVFAANGALTSNTYTS